MAAVTLKITRASSDDVFRSATILYRLNAARDAVLHQTFIAFNGQDTFEVQELEGFAYKLVVHVFGPPGANIEVTVKKGETTLVNKLKAEIATGASVTRRTKTFEL